MRYLFVILWVVSGCTGSSNPCAGVVCGSGRECDPTNGRCVRVDGGDVPVEDSGVPDAGDPDAGMGDGGIDCNPACTGGTKCDLSSGQCVPCLSNADCLCPDAVCTASGCIQPADDGGARPAPPGAEACSAATPFTLAACSPRTYRFRATLTGTDDEQGVCSAQSGRGRDLVYVLKIDALSDLRVDVVPVNGSTAEPVVYVRRMPCNGQELACVDSGGPFAASVLLRSRPMGDYAIFLDTLDAATGGEVEVTITLSAPTMPANETCLAADSIVTDGGVVQADLSMAANDEITSCNGTGIGSRDVAWSFVLDATSDIVARATGASGVSPFIEVRQGGCGPGSARGCAVPNAAGAAVLRVRSASPGTYYLVVESFDAGTSGPVDVSVAVQAPSPPLQHDTCAAPRDIVFADGGTLTEFDIDTGTAMDDATGTCNASEGGPEYIYRLRLLSPARVNVTAEGAGGLVDPVLYIRQGTCSTGVELGCTDVAGTTESLGSGMSMLPPGDYFIFIEGYGMFAGPTHVTVSATP